MKKQQFTLALLFATFISLSSCSVVGGIFKTGMGVGAFIVIFVIGIIIYFISRMGSNK